MIKPNIRQIAEKNGITTAYQLQKLLGIQPSLAAKWYRNDLKMIGFESLNTLCKAFKCSPSDLIVYTPDADAANDTKPSNTKANNTSSGNATLNSSLQDITALSNAASDMMTSADALSEFERIGKPKSDSSLRRYLQSGRLKGELVGREWEIEKSDFENFINSDFFKNLK
jgi:DNA-binding Xre family transcriptional regulator